jgi:hypothetical protein
MASKTQLSIRDPFYYSDIQNPKKYAIEVVDEETGAKDTILDVKALITALRRLLVIIDGANETYIMKDTSATGGFKLTVTDEMAAMRKYKHFRVFGAPPKTNMWDWIQDHRNAFVKRRMKFALDPEDDPNEIFITFQGLQYNLVENPDYSKIAKFLQHTKHVIAAGVRSCIDM